MKRARITCTFTIEFDLDPLNYDHPSITPEEMLAIDVQNFEDNPELLFEYNWEAYKVTGEIIND